MVFCNSSYITTLSDDRTLKTWKRNISAAVRCALSRMERVTCTVCAVGANEVRLAAVVDDYSMDSSILSFVSVC